jgi:hypothetical protein
VAFRGHEKIAGFRAIGNGSDLDRAALATRELCCISVLDNPPKQVGSPRMASTRGLTVILALTWPVLSAPDWGWGTEAEL